MFRFFERIAFSPEGANGGGSPSDAAGALASASPAPSSGGAVPSSAPSGGSPSAAPASGASPTGEGAPSQTGATSPSPPDSPEPFDETLLAGLEGSFDDDSDALFAPSVEATAPPAEPQPPQPPAAAPAAPPVEPAATPPKPGAGPQEATASLPTPGEPLRIAEAMEQNSSAIIDHLAATQFQLSKEELEALETDAAGTIPKLLAKTYMHSQMTALRQMARVIPAMMQQFFAAQRGNRENEQKFYSRWTDIKPKEHGAVVRKYAQLYRQANPEASLEQMIEDLGPLVMMAAKISPTQPRPNGNGATPQSGFRPPPSSPFVPAVGGAASPQPSADENPWMGLSGDFDSE